MTHFFVVFFIMNHYGLDWYYIFPYLCNKIRDSKPFKTKLMNHKTNLILLMSALLTLGACSGSGDDPSTPGNQPSKPESKMPINISMTVDNTRVTGNSFDNGDKIGLFVVNHNADGSAPSLTLSGNYANNVQYSYNGTWTPATPLYWKDNTTHADFYLYYPYTASLSSVDAMPFSVKANQSNIVDYKAGDLLIGKSTNIAPSESAVQINAKHMMSMMQVTVAPGNGFTAESLAAAQVSVKINGIKTQATANLSTGAITATGSATTITPLHEDGSYKALIVPQTVGESKLITVNVDGRDYNLTKAFTFESGKCYKSTVTVKKTSNGVNVDITKWEDDGVDYGGTAE